MHIGQITLKGAPISLYTLNRAHPLSCFDFFSENIPGEEDAMSLAAPAVAIAANQTKTMGHTAPLLPTPSVMNALGAPATPGLAGIAPGIPATTANANVSFAIAGEVVVLICL